MESKETSIEIWASIGIDIAKEKGKTIEDLCNYLRMAWGMRVLFDAILKEKEDGE